MKNRLTLIFAIIAMAFASKAFAQSARIVTTITTEKHDPAFSLGRDFWFAPAQNYIDEPGKYLRMYITSPNSTTAFVESQGITKAVPINANGIGIFNAPLEWEVKSSCIVENKGIHVFDPTDDIAVYFMSHNPYTGDGMYCIPTIGWGTEYVVASYESLFEGFGSYVYDFPSEFTVTADQDNTEVEITPTVNCRSAAQYPNGSTTICAPKGQVSFYTLNRGQCIQLQAVAATDSLNYDLTGTIIHSNVGIGVVGASTCPEIPTGWAYCDLAMEMMPPVRTWGETYYTTNPIQPDSLPRHDSSMYLMVASKNNQTIHRYNSASGNQIECTIDSQYHFFWAEEAGANKWYSNAPFLLVQYFNSSSYPDMITGNGNPAEVVISPKESYPKTVFTIAPPSVGAEVAFNNYANVIVNNKDSENVTFDGKSISPYTHYAVDDTFSIYLVPQLAVGTHVVKSDSGVGVYVYGYGYDETFSWGGSSGVGTFNSPDTVPPKAIVSSNCFEANIHITDSGYIPGSITLMQSGLNEIRSDTDVNMAFEPDPYPNWLDGAGLDTSGYSMSVIDITKPAILKVSAFDFAGNRTTITSTYIPQTASIEPSQNFAAGTSSGPAIIIYDTLINTGQAPFGFDTLKLLFGNKGFTIDSADVSALAVDEKRLIKISFVPVSSGTVVDSIIFGDQCIHQSATLIGGGGTPDFFVSDIVWPNEPLNPIPAKNWTMREALIHNLSTITIHVDTAGWTDRQHFVIVPGQKFPDTLTAYGTLRDTSGIWFYFEPTDTNGDYCQGTWKSPEVTAEGGIRFDSLIGNAVTPILIFGNDTTVTLDCPDTSIHSVQLVFLLANTGSGQAVIGKLTLSDTTHFLNLTGYDQHGDSWNPATRPYDIPPGAVDTFKVDFPINPQSNMSGATVIIAVDNAGDVIGVLTANVSVNYWADSLSSSTLSFGPVPFNSASDSEQFTITNTASSNLIINSLSLPFGGKYDVSFNFTTVPVIYGLAPDTLRPGQSITVTVLFDPGVSSDSVQQALLQIESNSCNTPNVTLIGYVKSSNGVSEESTIQSEPSIVQLDDARSIQVIIPSDWTQPVRIDIYNILGETVYTSSLNGTSTFDLGALTRGVYFYRLRENEINQTGKILLGQ